MSTLNPKQKQQNGYAIPDNIIPFPPSSELIPGMPEMDISGPAVSRYEFWPAWLFYTPVVLQSLWYSLKYRDIALPLIANPSIWLSGMVGESKQDILNLAGPYACEWILPFISVRKSNQSPNIQLRNDVMDAPINGFDEPELRC